MSIEIKPRIDDIRFVGTVDEETATAQRQLFMTTVSPAPYEIKGLDWTESESRIIRSSMWTIDLLIEGLGLELRPLHRRTIHIVQPEALAPITACEGVVAWRHAYFPRTSKKAVFAHAVLHELLHLTSFTGIRYWRAPEEDGSYRDQWGERRFGTAFIARRRNGSARCLYAGYNEAITEIIAKDLRRPSADRMNFTGDEKCEFLEREISYVPHVEIVHRLIKEVADSEPDGIDPYEQLALDYFNGTFSLVRRFEAVHPGSSRALARMGTRTRSAAECAEALGFGDVAAAFS